MSEHLHSGDGEVADSEDSDPLGRKVDELGVILGAAGVEMQMEAAYMFDGVADGEEESRDELSPAEELALAITLLYCG